MTRLYARAFLVLFLYAAAASAATTIATGPASDTTWNLAGSPYTVTARITVPAGVTLTIDPGVQVFMADFAGLVVNGHLTAVGTSSAPITFTRNTATGGWNGISVVGTSTLAATGTFSYIDVAYGGTGCCADLYVENGSVEVSHSSFRESAEDGIYVYSGTANVSDSTFTNNVKYPIEYHTAASNPVLTGITATGNGTNAIAISGGVIAGDANWTMTALPYLLIGSPTVAAGATLTLAPGVQLQALGSTTTLTINGDLVARGTSSAPIVLAGQTASKASWGGLRIIGATSTATATLDYVTISGGSGACSGCGDLYVQNGTVDITHCTISNSDTDGVFVYSGVANVADCTLTGNTGYPLRYRLGDSTSTLARLTASGNGTDAVAIGGGTITGSRSWSSCGLPYVVTSTPVVTAGATLTIAAGVQLQFVGSTTSLTVNGDLLARGTSSAPIVMTGQTAAKGAWGGLRIVGSPSTATAALDYVNISYGGGSCTSCADVYVENATVDIAHSTISNSGTDGVFVVSGVANVADCTLTGNTTYPLRYQLGNSNSTLARLTASGNGTDAVSMGGGTITGSRTWFFCGLPYVIAGSPVVAKGATLTIEPGVQAAFAAGTRLEINGALRAIGTDTFPIALTGLTPTPGFWNGVKVIGPIDATATAAIEYATIAHGGTTNCSCADIYVDNGIIHVAHAILRDSGTDGIWAMGHSVGSSVESSQIISNARYGVQSSRTNVAEAFNAANNWWGAATGPTTSNGCNPNGTGSAISGPVAFTPFLTAVDEQPSAVAPGTTPSLTITPRRWFAPADSLTPVWVALTLRDGAGLPMSGRTVHVASTRGTVTDGGVTDVNGQTWAKIISGTPGDAVLTAATEVQTVCDLARSQPSTITFTSTNDNPLRPDIEAPYLDGGIHIDPEPVTRGVLTMLQATLKNTNSTAISVDASFGIAQSGIGLTFGPVGDVNGTIIAPGAQATVQVPWTPPLEGHYCVQVVYSAQPVATSSVKALGGTSGRAQRNLNVFGAPLGPPKEKEMLRKADNAFKVIKKIPSGAGTMVPKAGFDGWWAWMKYMLNGVGHNMGGDPPRADYKIIAVPEPRPVMPVWPHDSDVSAARLAARSAYSDAVLDVVRIGNAATISMDRAGGAAEAHNFLWASQQTAALLEYKKRLGAALITAADKLDAFRQLLASEGVTTLPVTEADFASYQQRLQTEGFSAQELEAAHLLWLTDSEIEAFKQEILATTPAEVAGDVMAYYALESGVMRDLGQVLSNPQNFPPQSTATTGSAAVEALAAPNNLARVFTSTSTIEVANPLGTAATIDLRARVIDLPSDWSVALVPSSLTLNPSEQKTVTVTITPGTPVPQGSVARVAVEGYDGTTLLGGVVEDVVVPTALPFRLSIAGDANGDGDVTMADVFYDINYVFANGAAPVAGDANGDNAVTAADVFYMLNYLFAGGPMPK